MMDLIVFAAEATPKESGFFDAKFIVTIISALGVGTIISSAFAYFGNRKKTSSESNKLDADTELAKLATVIDRLDDENKRIIARELRTQEELSAEQDRSAKLRSRVRELEDEIDSVRASARETQQTARETQRQCDQLGARLKELVGDAQEKE